MAPGAYNSDMDRTGTFERLSGFFAESPADAADVVAAWLFVRRRLAAG